MAKLIEIINNKKEIILATLTFILIIVTIFQIISTNSIRNVESFLAKERLKEDLKTRISLAEEAIQELSENNNAYNDTLVILQTERENIMLPLHDFSSSKLEQANEIIGFGDKETRMQIKRHITEIKKLRLYIEQIKSPQYPDEDKNKFVNATIIQLDVLYRGGYNPSHDEIISTSDLIKKIDNYKNTLETELSTLDKQMISEIDKLNQ